MRIKAALLLMLSALLVFSQPATVPRPGGGSSLTSTTSISQIIQVGDTNWIRSWNGKGTNTLLRRAGLFDTTTNAGTLLGGRQVGQLQIMQTNWCFRIYTNTNPGITVSFNAGVGRWTLAGTTVQALELRENDIVVEYSGSAYQTIVTKILSSTQFETFDYSPGITRVASPDFQIIYATLTAYDSDGDDFGGGINGDGGYSIKGAVGFNSSGYRFFHGGDGRANWSLSYFNYGPNDGIGFYNHFGGGTAQGLVWHMSTNATEGAWIMSPDSRITWGFGGTNLGQYWIPNISTQALSSAVAMVTTDGAGKIYESVLPVAGSTNWLTDANGNGYGVNVHKLTDRTSFVGMYFYSETTTNGGNSGISNFVALGNPYVVNGATRLMGDATIQDNIGVFSSNFLAVASNTAGDTNTTGFTEVWNISGTSGTIAFWNRIGFRGDTPAGISLWTNTVVTTGKDYIVGPNCGIQLGTAVGTVISRRSL